MQELLQAYKGADPDKPMQRAAAAAFVGLSVPEAVPLGRSASDAASRYNLASKIRTMSEEGDLSTLTGLDNIKAQYFGISGVAGNTLGGQKDGQGKGGAGEKAGR